jgi:hypothetical protein
MKEEDLKRLVDRYYNGECSDEEERTLRDFFRSSTVPQGYEAEKEIFSYYNESEVIPEPSVDFEARLMAGIDASIIFVESKKKYRNLITIMSAAAGLLLLAGSYFFFINRVERTDTFSDPELAYAETVRVLRDVSSQLNHGTRVLEPVGKINEISRNSFTAINNSTRIIQKNLKTLDYLKNGGEAQKISTEKNINK